MYIHVYDNTHICICMYRHIHIFVSLNIYRQLCVVKRDLLPQAKETYEFQKRPTNAISTSGCEFLL